MEKRFGTLSTLASGLLLCMAMTALAEVLATIESRVFGHAWLESLVLAILLGTGVRTVLSLVAAV